MTLLCFRRKFKSHRDVISVTEHDILGLNPVRDEIGVNYYVRSKLVLPRLIANLLFLIFEILKDKS
jgi:hypothetical protein